MNIRPTQTTALSSLQSGLFMNLAKIVRAQEQLATGKRILRVSDDPGGATLALAYGRRAGDTERFLASLQSGRNLLDSSATRLEESGELLVRTRELLLQGMNGTLSSSDRATLAQSVEQLRERLLELANDQVDGRYLFGGTATNGAPFSASTIHGVERVAYVGNAQAQRVQVGDGSYLQTTLPGFEAFSALERGGASYSGLTGAQAGTSADQGSGFTRLDVRHDGTSAVLGAGLALANGGADDTLLGIHSLVVDAVAGTVQLDNGPALAIPAAGAANLADFVVTDENGAELHLDFSGYSGASFSGSVSGAASLSLDGSNYTSINFGETDLQLVDDASDVVLHVDTRGIRRAGVELVVFDGTVNAFDTLRGIADDLANVDGLDFDALSERFDTWLGELDRNHENVLAALGGVGARAEHAVNLAEALGEQGAQFDALRSNIEDADLGTVALELSRAQTTLELVQATSARLLSTSLLDFLR